MARLIEPQLGTLAERLGRVRGLGEAERGRVLAAADAGLRNLAHIKLNRVLLLELHAAALTGQLDAAGERRRWDQFIELASTTSFDEHLRRRYPRLHERLTATCRYQLEATLTLVDRLVADREAFAELPGRPGGELVGLTLGAGDSHRGGHTVARLDFAEGSVLYKPRPLQVDAAMQALLDQVLAGRPDQDRIRVPRVLVRDGYGWAEFIEHRYCEGDAELGLFYRNLGHWLAVMRLVGGTDLHSENIIAHGPIPVVVDVESVFTPDPAVRPSGQGDAVDVAAAMIRSTVLRTGILPVRAGGLALAGVDISAAGALPGQQPQIPLPTIVGGGTDTARLGMTAINLPPTKNHPSPKPILERYWGHIVDGFRELTTHLQSLDAGPGVIALLRPFLGCEVRRILRSTQAYIEIARMLWHPASLHDESAALTRARDILRRNAEALAGAPSEPAIIDREIEDMYRGDVPVFTTSVDEALIEQTVASWQSADLALEEMTIQSALVSAYLNEQALPPRTRIPARRPDASRLDSRRRSMAATLVKKLCDAGIRGSDGTVTWISPVLAEHGWAIRVLSADVYSGQGGVAICLAEYMSEARHGRVEEVKGVADTFTGALTVLRATEDQVPMRQFGGFGGLASQVWTWSTLYDLLGEPWLLERARARAEVIEQRIDEDDRYLEVLYGMAGVIVPMLNLSEQTGEARWLRTAAAAGRRLESTARHEEAGARWSTYMFPEAIGGFAHGATGMGWALTRLGHSAAGTEADRKRWLDLADRAFAFEESLYRPKAGNWADIRGGKTDDFIAAWCHGSTGIGLAACDLYARLGEPQYLDRLRRACAAGLKDGFGWTHTLCHGDLGLWTLLDTARTLDPDYSGPDRKQLDAEVLSSVEERGPVGGLSREAFSPGLMAGLAGVIHLLLRMHPEHRVSSPLVLGRCPGTSSSSTAARSATPCGSSRPMPGGAS